MSLARYACCRESIGDPHAAGCEGTPRYPRGRERQAAERHAREVSATIEQRRS